MDNITQFYKDKTTADHRSYNEKWFYKYVAYDDRYKIVSSYMNKYLMDKEGLKILDVACGTGIYERMLDSDIKKKHNFIGIDISGPHLEINRKTGIFDEIVEGDINDGLPFEDESFDIVILSEIIEHLFEPEKIINDVHRVLKKGGIILLTTPNLGALQIRTSFILFGNSWEIDYAKNFQHIRFFSKKAIDKIMGIFGKENLIYQRACATLFFYPNNFQFYLPVPRFLQILFSRLFPNSGIGFFKVYKK